MPFRRSARLPRCSLFRAALSALSALLVIFFGGVLYSYGGTHRRVARRDHPACRHDNAQLIVRLNEEKTAAEATRDHAQAGERAKSTFISNISQELRTPLNAILGMAQLLERSELEKAQRDHVKVLLEAGRGLKTLLDDIIALAQPDATRRSPSRSRAATPPRRRGPWRGCSSRTRGKSACVCPSMSRPALPRVACDPRLLRRVLLKIAGNAIKFTERGNVEIALDAEHDEAGRLVRFAITDTGPGIPAHLIGDLRAVRQADEPMRAAATARASASQSPSAWSRSMGGSIGVDSEPGMGARFWVMIPPPRRACGNDSGEKRGAAKRSAMLDWRHRSAMRATIDRMVTPFGNRLTFAHICGRRVRHRGAQRFRRHPVHGRSRRLARGNPLAAYADPGAHRVGRTPPTGASHVLRWPASADAL